MKQVTLVLSTALLLTNVVAAFGAVVNVDVKTSHQTIRGFGTCSAWCGTLTKEEGDLLFSTTKGAGLSLHRIMIERNGATQSEIANTKLASSYGVTVWGTPWYCKNGVKVAGKDYDTLYEKDYQAWADVLAATSNTLKNAGTPLYAMSSGNETDLGWTKFDAPTLANWVGKYMGPTLAAKAPEVKVMGVETCNWYGFSGYYKTFKANAEAWKYSSILATHLYGGNPTAYPEIQAAGKEFWQTEIYDTDTRTEDPGMGSALRVCKLIHDALTIANMNAWHFWWIKPCSGCNNGALWVEATKKPAKRLWIMGNWSRYVRPGFVRIGATAAPTAGVTVSAYRDSALSKVVIVAYNTTTSNTPQEFSISGTTPVKLTPCITDPAKDLVEEASRPLTSSTFSYTLPAQSVTTLVVDLAGTSVLPSSKARNEISPAFRANCSGSTLRIWYPAHVNGLASVKFFNLQGQLVKTAILPTTSGAGGSRSLDLSDIPRDYYIVKIENGEGLQVTSAILYL